MATRSNTKRVVRRTASKAPAARRTAAGRSRGRIGLVSLIAVGTLVALGAAVVIAAAVDPRADAMLRRGWRNARGVMDDLPEIPMGRLENLGGQIAELGQRLGSLARATAQRF